MILGRLGFQRADLHLALGVFRMVIRDRYLGTGLGSIWAMANPLMMLAIYTYVFGFVFKVKLPGAERTLDYVIWLISGLGPWMAMVEALVTATFAVVSGAGFVKNMSFKTELLPVASAFTGLVPLGVTTFFLFGLLMVEGRGISAMVLYLPLVMAIQFLFIAGLGLFFSAIHVFMRDFGVALPNVLMLILFLTPIFYPLESVPGPIRSVTIFNPVYIIIESLRLPLVYDQPPDLKPLLFLFIVSVVIFLYGLRFFRRRKGMFGAML